MNIEDDLLMAKDAIVVVDTQEQRQKHLFYGIFAKVRTEKRRSADEAHLKLKLLKMSKRMSMDA